MRAFDVVVLGTAPLAPLRKAGITNVIGLPNTATTTGFDESSHTWTLDHGGQSYRARIVIADAPTGRGDGLRPYLGVAVHGRPNYFVVGQPAAVAQLRYIAECLKVMARKRSTRIEVRYSTQRVFNDHGSDETKSTASHWRRMRQLVESAFDFGGDVGVDDDVYDGPAQLRLGAREYPVRTRLTGHLDPIDGRFHWQGTVFADLPEDDVRLPQPVQVAVAGRSAAARIVERTPWGSYSVAGVGAPPFLLDALEVSR